MLKFQVDSLEGINVTDIEKILGQPLYVQSEDDKKYYLNVEGVVNKDKLDEFRNNNIELTNKVKKFETDFKDVDPKKYKELVKMEQDGRFSGKTNEEIDKIIQERVSNMRTELETQIAELTKVKDVQASQLSVLLVDNVVRDAASKNGVAGPATDDILLRAKSVFKLVDGKPVPHDERGNVIYGTDGTSPMSVGAWVSSLKKVAPHLFQQSTGSGAPGGRPGSANTENLSSLDKIRVGLENTGGK